MSSTLNPRGLAVPSHLRVHSIFPKRVAPYVELRPEDARTVLAIAVEHDPHHERRVVALDGLTLERDLVVQALLIWRRALEAVECGAHSSSAQVIVRYVASLGLEVRGQEVIDAARASRRRLR